MPTLAFPDGETRAILEARLRTAEAEGAVATRMDRDAPHLIGQVRLADATRLYALLGRTPRVDAVELAAAALAGAGATTTEGASLAAWLAEGWRSCRRPLGIGPDDSADAAALVMAADAAFTPSDAPLRARSIRHLGDSKALERMLPRLFAFLRETGRLDPDLANDEAAAALGLERFAPAVLLAGPLAVRGTDMDHLAYAGIAPEDVASLDAVGPLRAVVTVENLESFNRHVREARRPGHAILYTGGFPSRSVVAALRRLEELGADTLFHWGDVDLGGLRIANRIHGLTGLEMRLHLMSRELSIARGRPVAPLEREPDCPAGAPTTDLARFLASPEAHRLEQEEIDPEPPVEDEVGPITPRHLSTVSGGTEQAHADAAPDRRVL